jgi:hypothetical protein
MPRLCIPPSKATVLDALSLSQRVGRLSARARAFHRLVELSEQDQNMGAAVAAVRTMVLEGEDAAHRGAAGVPTQPGLVIQIVTSKDPATVGPTIEHEPRHDE